ncbi:alpha/beta fold hydrolase [Glycomyces buryatensis]|uniref:Alpha/beta hydrolase n=1 Tax=Glycomyces buryatensis TaxID=2570927 RepID=A0A4S8Q7G7_9ACTN|nr:alpha/beta hydrolase [Glycomyces buryatensis]THV40188.1 alpha/beta hydrolase [Glycomyces buryatensis]
MSQASSDSLHFVEYGEGVPLLAIHGWTPDHRLMTGCLEPLFSARPGWRRLYPDLPGMGSSPAPESINSSDDILAALENFIDEQIGDRPFALAGESYGGYLARAIAGARRDQVIGLALICPIGTELDPAKRHVPAHEVIAPDPELMAGLSADQADRFGPMAVVQSAETLRRFQTEVEPGLDAANLAAMERIRERWELRESPEAGAAYPGPSVIITGRQDSSTGYADTYSLLDHYPRATFAVLDRAGHNAQIEQPDLFNALIGEWLNRVEEALALG